jgi:broad specificity phosphatase PhoE
MQQGWGGYAQFGMLGGQPQYGQIPQSGVRQVPGFSNGHYMSSPSPSSSSTPGGTGHQQNANRGINKTPTPLQQPTQFHSLQRQLSAVTIGSASSTPPVVPARSSGASSLAPTQQTQSLAPTQQTQATPDKFVQKSNNGGRQHWPLELWICRHGETVENNTRTIAGQNSSGLTEHGREQASLLGERLTNVDFVGIYISDLNRTKQTADAVLRARAPGTPAFTDSRLREKGAGSYEGQKIGYIEKMTQMSGMPHRVFRPPGGESWEDVSQRSRSFMREVLSRYCTCTDQIGRPFNQRGYDSTGRPINTGYAVGPVETKRVLIITHGGFMSEFLSLAVGGVPNCAKNCSIFVLACARDHPQGRTQFLLKVLNEVSHVRCPHVTTSTCFA